LLFITASSPLSTFPSVPFYLGLSVLYCTVLSVLYSLVSSFDSSQCLAFCFLFIYLSHLLISLFLFVSFPLFFLLCLLLNQFFNLFCLYIISLSPLFFLLLVSSFCLPVPHISSTFISPFL
jgi:hypothetical protein